MNQRLLDDGDNLADCLFGTGEAEPGLLQEGKGKVRELLRPLADQ